MALVRLPQLLHADMYCMVVHSCTVDDGDKALHQVVDDNGLLSMFYPVLHRTCTIQLHHRPSNPRLDQLRLRPHGGHAIERV